MNKYIVLSAAALVISLTVGCQNCGYKTAHSSPYETLVGTTRLASPQTNYRYNVCGASSACNPCNACSTCSTQMLANNAPIYSNPYAQDGYQNGWYQSYAGENASSNTSLLDGTQQQTAQGETPLRWRRVTEEEQQYANSSVDPASAGVASALSAPAFGSPAPAPNIAPRYPNSSPRAARGVASALDTPGYPAPGTTPQYSGQYPPRYPNSSPRAARGVASALDTPGYPESSAAPQYSGQYPNQYPNSYPRTTAGVDPGLSVPNHPLPRQYSNQYPNASPRVASGVNPAYNNPSYGAPNPGAESEPIRWRRVTEEEQQQQQQYYNATPDAPMGYDSSQTAPVYPGNNTDAAQTPEYPTAAPEIDPNLLPMPESPTGTF